MLQGEGTMLRDYLRFFSRLLIACGMILGASESLRAQDMAPIFSFEYQSDVIRILETSALEPNIRRLSSERQASALYSKLLARLDSLRPDADPSSKELRRAFIDAASINFFYLTRAEHEESAARVTQARDWLADFAERYSRKVKKSSLRAIGQYYYLVAEIGRSRGSSGAITQLVDLKPALARKKELVANIDLFIAYSLLQIGATAKQGLEYIDKAPSPSVYGKLGERLMKAQYMAGLNGSGERFAESKPDAVKEIRYVIQVAKGLPKGLQNYVLNSCFFIWHKALRDQYQKPPFELDGFVAIRPVDAYWEEQALLAIKSAQIGQAIAIYDKIVDGYRGQAAVFKIESRIWQLELRRYTDSQNPNGLEMRFVRYHDRYGKQAAGSASYRKQAKSFFDKISTAYSNLVLQMLTQAISHQNDQSLLNRSIILAEKLLRIIGDQSDDEVVRIKFRLAQLYRKTSQYRKAVALFLDLAKSSPDRMLPYAIEAQSQLASWPLSPPWIKFPDGVAKERAKLAEIYQSLLARSKAPDWKYLAQIGLLYRALGQHSKVETLWMKHLEKSSANEHSNEAAGQLLSGFYRAKRWPELIKLAYMVRGQKVRPTLGLKPFDTMPYLADALFNQGQIDLNKQQSAAAIANFSDFIKFFPRDQRVPGAYYNLATAYKTMGKLVPSLNALKILVDQYPSLTTRKQILLQGGQWSAATPSTVEYAFFFYSKYLREYPREANIPQVREVLANLYFERKLYGWSARLYKEQSLAQNVPANMQLNAAIRFMEIEEKYGRPQDAAFGANRILQLARPNTPVAGKAFAFLARYAASKNDLNKMRELEPRLLTIANSSPDAREALGHIRFKMAEMLTKPIQNNENNHLLKDPEGAVKTYFDAFNREKRYYSVVCQGGMSTLCGPSMLRLTLLTRMAMAAINKVAIAETLGGARVNAFNVFKQLHMSKLQEAETFYGKEAVRLAKQGTTTPIWRSEILKTLNEGKFQAAH